MVAFVATLRLPSRTPSVRRVSRVRSALTIGFASVVLSLLPLRLMLSAAGIAQWTTSWRTVEFVTTPFVFPFTAFDPFERLLVRNVMVAELLAAGAFDLVALYLLALLTVRRKR